VVDPVVWHRTSAAFDLPATDYIRYSQRYRQIAREVNQRLAGFDAWLSPTTPNAAPLAAGFDSVEKVAQWNRINTANVRPGNLFDQCGTTLPLTGATTGLPVGFQVMGKRGDDDQLLALSVAIEAVIGRGRVADMSSFI
jgi:aspartyl-tRNA(Asn)/glutamyl-tRNA(Gln) amidotransferase subunit A